MSLKRAVILSLLIVGVGIYITCTSTVQVKKDHIGFSHAVHSQVTDCSTCHRPSKDGRVMGLPKMDKCLSCHQDQANNCKMCHSNPEHPGTYSYNPERLKIRFSHAMHKDRVKKGCKTCHKNPANNFKKGVFVGHQTVVCMQCHEHKKDFAKANCTKCHKDMAELPPKRVAEFVHRDVLITGRHTVNRGNIRTCANCHDRTFCTDCHAKSTKLKPDIKFPQKVGLHLVHRGDYIATHRFDVARLGYTCNRCHGRSFCVDCHQARGVRYAGSSSPASPHPPGWVTNHGMAARANIISCASCHDKGAKSNCVKCHGPAGINPHPPNWNSKAHLSITSRSCRICHK